MITDCLHGLAALGGEGLAALLGAMLLAGLAGGATHCAGMCGPFVMAQVAAGGALEGGALRRLAGAALLPYQAGRAIGYGALGAVAGGTGALAAGLLPHGVLALPLGLAAAVMLAQALARLGARVPALPSFGWRLPGLDALLAGPPSPLRGLALGLLLSALPCGLLYGALAAAAGAGSALGGALAMLAFVLGTVPALAAVALLGRLFGRRFGARLGHAASLLLLLNAGVLGGLAFRALG